MRIKEIMERATPAYDPDAGFLRNVGRAGLDRFVRSQLGIDAYSDEEETKNRSDRAAQREIDRQKAAANQAAKEIDQANVPAVGTAPQTSAANTQFVSPASAAPAQTASTPSTPNFAQGTAGRTTVNAPTAAVPAIRPYVPQVSTAAAAPVQTPAVNPAAPPEVYYLDNQPLNPNNPIHSKLIAQLQQQGITRAKTGTPKK